MYSFAAEPHPLSYLIKEGLTCIVIYLSLCYLPLGSTTPPPPRSGVVIGLWLSVVENGFSLSLSPFRLKNLFSRRRGTLVLTGTA
jgi:hypothetical protein